eukprot:1845953-Prymnesium_polylepis.1
MSYSTRVQYCGAPLRSRVWSRCSPSGSCQDTSVGSYPPSFELEHRPLGQPRERHAAWPPVRQHAEPSTAGLREATGAEG